MGENSSLVRSSVTDRQACCFPFSLCECVTVIRYNMLGKEVRVMFTVGFYLLMAVVISLAGW